MDSGNGRQIGGWTNKLIWGDNRLILSSLTNGPMRQQVEDAGGLKLIYIDPPFDVGANFSMDVEIGDEKVTKSPSVIEEVAYRDTWGRGSDSYLSMLLPRLQMMKDLLADDGSIYVHVDWRLSGQVRLLMDEVFGAHRLRNQIAWCYTSPGRSPSRFKPCHDTLLYYSKSDSPIWNNPQQELAEATLKVTSLKFKGQDKEWTRERTTKDMVDWWEIIFHTGSSERIGYPTQKPEALIERIIEASSRPGDLVGDFFCGSGTTPAVAERLGRKWIAADLGRFAIHTTRKRLISVQRKLRSAEQEYRAFEVLNLGAYERQHFVDIDLAISDAKQAQKTRQRDEAYLSLVLNAYAGERAVGTPPFHGVKGTTALLVGPIDAPVTEKHVREAIIAAIEAGITRVDVLGFEFEMGLKPLLQDEAREQGVNLALRYIPNDVFDTRAVKAGDVKFHDVAYVDFLPSLSGVSVTVTLTDFAVFYRQDDAEAAAAGLKSGSSRVVVDNGQVVKVAKDKQGLVSRDVLTGAWTDWIDYWAVDFDYMSQPEILRVIKDGVEEQVKTGRYIFENRWQSFRTKQDRQLELTSATHQYSGPGTFMVAVKVIDIFGNDTTRVLPVQVKG